jgi:hypothetical protein
MRFLVDGFEHLETVSSQIPETLRETAIKNKNSLLATTGRNLTNFLLPLLKS